MCFANICFLFSQTYEVSAVTVTLQQQCTLFDIAVFVCCSGVRPVQSTLECGDFRGVRHRLHHALWPHGNRTDVITGYNQSVTGSGSQRRQCSCYSTKTHVNSMIIILKLNLTSYKFTLKVVFVEQKKTHFNVYVSQRSQIQFED